jgi:hypothetical protein
MVEPPRSGNIVIILLAKLMESGSSLFKSKVQTNHLA